MKVYAAEHCGCVHESGFSVIPPLHTTEAAAFIAMHGHKEDREASEAEYMGPEWVPCEHESWRVIEYTVNVSNASPEPCLNCWGRGGVGDDVCPDCEGSGVWSGSDNAKIEEQP